MRQYILVIMTVVGSIASSEGSPHHHDDEYRQARRLLKAARRAERQEAAYNNQNFFQGQGSNPVSQLQERPGGSLNGGNFGTIGSALPSSGGSSSNFPQRLPNIPSAGQIGGQLGNLPTLPPYPIEQVNRGVSTILNGVRSLDLGQILRGAFVFPRNENVRSVANNVLDSIFGAAKSTPTGGNF